MKGDIIGRILIKGNEMGYYRQNHNQRKWMGYYRQNPNQSALLVIKKTFLGLQKSIGKFVGLNEMPKRCNILKSTQSGKFMKLFKQIFI